MENKKVIFAVEVEGDNARVKLDGTGEDIVTGLVMMLGGNKDMPAMFHAAMELFKDLPENLKDFMEEDDTEN